MNVNCPQCSGKNRVELTDYDFLTCSFCGNSLYIDYDGVSLAFTYKSMIDSEEAPMYLKRDFEKAGFSEGWRLINSFPVYMPFWEIEGTSHLKNASSKLKADIIPKPSQEKRIFDYREMEGVVEKEEPDSQPDVAEKRSLYYLPFYQVVVTFKEKKYSFFVNGISGKVYGDPIPFLSAKEIGRFFPFFLLMFIIFFTVNLMFNNVIVLVLLNLILVFLFFYLSLAEMVKKLYKNES